MNKLVTVIIPFYNVEEYIEKCLKSVIEQTYKNLEILCIDDCTPDNSSVIVSKYMAADDRIKLIKHKNNLGLGGARNTGIKEARGEFIYFLDSDDYIEKDYIEKMVYNIKSADLICNNKVVKFYEDGSKEFIKNKDITNKYQVLDFKPELIDLMLTAVWCKLYRRDFLIDNKFFFPEKLKFEDFYFINVLKTKLKSVVFSYDSTYYYRQRKNSIIGQYKVKNDQKDSLYIIENIYKYYKENNLLNDYEVPFKWLYKFFRRQKHKNTFFKNVKNFISEINYSLNIDKYSKKNRLFVKFVLNSNNYYSFKIKYLLGKIL